MHWDNLPDCRVRFGSPGAELITGQGHRIYWIALPIEARSKLSGLLDAASAGHPRRETRLRWEFLLPPHVPT
mgnify:CR=1 FL=1